MLLSEIIEILNAAYPPELACSWDNCGLLASSGDGEVSAVLLTLDVTEQTVAEAAAAGAQLILSHHPILFSGAKRIVAGTPEGRILLSAIKSGISIFAAHTNCDAAPGGINSRLAEIFELQNPTCLDESGIGRVGDLPREVPLAEFAEAVKARLNTPHVRVCGELKRKISRAAICSGAGSDFLPAAMAAGAQVLLTGDTKYHEMLEAAAEGLAVIDAGHFPTEAIVCDIFEKLLDGHGLKLIKSHNCDVYKYI